MAFGALKGVFSAGANSTVNPQTASGSVAVVAGDLVYAVFGQQISSNVTAITDNLGNTYTPTRGATDVGGVAARVFYSYVTVAGTITTLSAACTANSNNVAFVVAVVEGPFAAPPIDANPAHGTADLVSPFTCPSTGTLAQADEVVLCWAVWNNDNVFAATSPNLLAVSRAGGLAMTSAIGYQVVSSTTAVAPEFTGPDPSELILGTTSFKKDTTPSGQGVADSDGIGAASATAIVTAAAASSAAAGISTAGAVGVTILSSIGSASGVGATSAQPNPIKAANGAASGAGAAAGIRGSGAYTFVNAEAAVVVSEMTVQPRVELMALIDNTIGDFKASGFWAACDLIGCLAVHDAQAATINWKNPTGTKYALTGAYTFKPYVGFTGDGLSGYINTNWAPNLGVNFGQDNAHASVYVAAYNTGDTGFGQGGATVGRTTSVAPVALNAHHITLGLQGRLNATTFISSTSVTTPVGWSVVNRTNATSTTIRKNAVQIASGGQGASTRNTQTIFVGRQETVYSSDTFGFFSFGSSLVAFEAATYATLQTFMAGAVALSDEGAGLASGVSAANADGRALVPATGSAAGIGTAAGFNVTAATASAAGISTASAVGNKIATAVGESTGSYIRDENGQLVLDENGQPIWDSAHGGRGEASAVGEIFIAGVFVLAAGSADGAGAASAVGKKIAAAVGETLGGYLLDENGELVLDENGLPIWDSAQGGAGEASAVGVGITGVIVSAVGNAAGTSAAIAVSFAGAAIGTAAGTSTAAATGTKVAAAAGSVAAGTGAASATGARVLVAAGSAAGLSTASAPSAPRNAVQGTSAGVGAATGAGVKSAAAAGAAIGTGTAAGSSNVAATVSATGLAAGTSLVSAVGRQIAAALGGNAVGVGTANGSSAKIVAAVGTAGGSGTAVAVGGKIVAAVGTAGGSGTAVAVGRKTAAALGSAAGVGGAVAISFAGAAVAAATGTGTAAAIGAQTVAAKGAAIGTGTAVAIGAKTTHAVGLAAGTSTASANGVSVISGVGNATGTSGASSWRRVAQSSLRRAREPLAVRKNDATGRRVPWASNSLRRRQ